MGDKARILYDKFWTDRTDDVPGEKKQDGCEYFLLDATHDRYAAAALYAYANACRREFPSLAEDVWKMATRNAEAFEK